jgi:hypothetical protein
MNDHLSPCTKTNDVFSEIFQYKNKLNRFLKPLFLTIRNIIHTITNYKVYKKQQDK